MRVDPVGDGRPHPTLPASRAETLRLDPSSMSPREARLFVRQHLGSDDPQTLEAVLLVATELVTNSVVHARTPIDLTLEMNESAVLVRVFDSESVVPQVQPHDVDRTDGRGIALVRMVSHEWGTLLHDGGKTVWALIGRG